MMDAKKLQSWFETPELVSTKALCKQKTGRNNHQKSFTGILLGNDKKVFRIGLGLICLALIIPSAFGQAPTSSQATTPWTNSDGQAVSRVEEPSSMTSVPSSQGYNGIKTTELTITPMQMDTPPIRLTQGVVARENLPQAATKEAAKQVSLPAEQAASEAPANAPRLAQSSGIPQPGSRDRTSQFLPPDSALLQPGMQHQEGQSRERKMTLPDGREIDLSKMDSVTIPQDNRMNPVPTQPLPPNNSNHNVPGTTTDPGLGPNPVKSPIIAAPEKHRSVFGFGSIGRNADGSMNGNPYAIAEPNDGNARCAIADFRPGRIPYDPTTEGRTRLTIPEGAYGSDGWGNDGTACLMDGNCGGCGFLLRNMQLGVGILGYTTPMDVLGQGNFGADISLNWATPSRWLCGLSAQAGGRLTSTGQNGIHGSSLAQDKGSTQFFWSSGLFYRNPCSQWQFGAVYDSLNSSYLSSYTIGQVRAELSHKFGCKTDLGFLGAFRVNDSMVNWWRINNTPIEETIKPVSWYSGFIRHYFDMGGEGMLYAGATENSEALAGGRIEVPISDYISLKNDFAYVFTDRKGLAGQDERSWNVSITLTLYFGGNCRESLSNPLRPLFDVANNSSFLQAGTR